MGCVTLGSITLEFVTQGSVTLTLGLSLGGVHNRLANMGSLTQTLGSESINCYALLSYGPQ